MSHFPVSPKFAFRHRAGEITVEAAVVLALIRVEELVEVFRKWGKTSGEEIVERLVEIPVELIVEEVPFPLWC